MAVTFQHIKESKSDVAFHILNTLLLVLGLIVVALPLLNVLASSLSTPNAVITGKVSIWPVGWNVDAYVQIFQSRNLLMGYRNSILYTIVGTAVNIVMTVLAAYPLSKSDRVFKARKYYSAYFVFLMIFNGGLIPTYYVISKLGLIDTIWALVLPCGVPIFNVILMMNFFRGIPESLEESAMLEGAGQWTIMSKIYLPLSKPSIATVTLFSLINHWNSWFDGLIYSNFTDNYPLQSYLQTMVVDMRSIIQSGNMEDIVNALSVNDKNLKAAQIFISIIPLMVIYPFCQKYFTAGLTLGSVKG